MIRLLLLDDHPVLRHGIKSLLATQPDLSVVAETGSPTEAQELARTEQIDVALVDIDLGQEQDGADTCRLILEASPETRVIAFTAFDSDADVVRMIDAGAVGYMLKDSAPQSLYAAIRSAHAGVRAIAAPIATRLDAHSKNTLGALTARELEVLQLAASGLSNRDLARELYVSEATVKTHLHNAFTKLQADNRQAAIATAIRQGIVRL